MENNSINSDKKLREKLSNRDFGPPPEAFLKDINARLDKKSKKTFLLFLLLDVIFLLLLFWPYNGKSEEQQNKIVTNYPNKELTTTDTTSPFEKSISKKEDLLISKKRKAHPKEKWKASGKANLKKKGSIKKGRKKGNTSFLKQKKVVQSKNASFPAKKKPTTFIKGSSSTESNKNFSKKKPLPSLKGKKNPNSEKNIVSPKVNKENTIKKSSLPQKTKESLPPKELLPKADTTKRKKEKTNIEKEVKEKKTKKDKTRRKKRDKTKRETSNKLSYELQLFGGISQSFLEITEESVEKYESGLEKRINNPISPVFGIGVNFYYQNWLLGSGITFFQNKEKIDRFTFTYSQKDSVYVAGTHIDSVYLLYDSINKQWDSIYVTSPIYDTLQVQQAKKHKQIINQAYSWITIPLRFGYKFTIKKWAITPSIGANIAIGIKTKPLQYPASDFQSMQKFQPVRWHANLMGSLELRRRFNQWHVFVRGGYQYSLSPFMRTEYFALKYNRFNAVIGIGYRW